LKEDAPPYRVTGENSPSPRGEGRGEGGRSDKQIPKFIDLFCGIGGFRLAFKRAGGQCGFSSDWNEPAQTRAQGTQSHSPVMRADTMQTSANKELVDLL
jgi:hypothetical protein